MELYLSTAKIQGHILGNIESPRNTMASTAVIEEVSEIQNDADITLL